jgi:hypothetical protein
MIYNKLQTIANILKQTNEEICFSFVKETIATANPKTNSSKKKIYRKDC